MDSIKAKKASKLLEEIEKYSRYKSILVDREYKDVAHFKLVQHYGDHPTSVDFNQRYNDLFIPVVTSIIDSLEKELDNL